MTVDCSDTAVIRCAPVDVDILIVKGGATSVSTMRDVAALAGVSLKTVSRVVNHDRYVSQGVRDRVNHAIAQLSFVPNSSAQSLRTGRGAAIGIAVPDLADPFFGAIIHAVEQAARLRGAAVLVTSLGYDPAEEQAAVEALLSHQIASLIIAPVSSDQSYLKGWQSRIHMVFVDRPPRHLVADSIIEDDLAGAELATARLACRGHRRVGFIAPSGAVVTVARRRDGYRATLSNAGLPADSSLEMLYEDEDVDAEEGCQRLLALSDPPTALFCGNLVAATKVVALLHRIKRTDLALISFGDFPMAATLTPAVTVIDQRPDLLGQAAAHRLFHRIDHPGSRLKRHVILPVSLTERDTGLIVGPYPKRAEATA